MKYYLSYFSCFLLISSNKGTPPDLFYSRDVDYFHESFYNGKYLHQKFRVFPTGCGYFAVVEVGPSFMRSYQAHSDEPGIPLSQGYFFPLDTLQLDFSFSDSDAREKLDFMRMREFDTAFVENRFLKLGYSLTQIFKGYESLLYFENPKYNHKIRVYLSENPIQVPGKFLRCITYHRDGVE